ncbi:MAG: family transporter substrate-binding protein [Naasia sp.]|jgi:basic membrane protein A|uniref:putative B6 ABC transporter substrate-binding protein n=1 Tax=Naasia sp. TaxID=2546198 RepID=UPI002632F3DE|nr:BMP family ABC transporter substrate-binding protein [Naasia sp.]MCU1570444.1 family transporter substrate-binding protein [Naasia sp.]
MYKAITSGISRRTVTGLGALVAVTALTIGLGGCASQAGGTGTDTGTDTSASAGSSAAAPKITKIAFVAPENETDLGWNQVGIANSKAAADKLGLEYVSVPDAGWDNTETVLGQVIKDDGAQFVIAHASGYGVAAQTVSAQMQVPILAQDSGLEPVPGQLAEALVEAQQGGYLAGIAAAMSTESKTVAVVISADDVNWLNMAAGFAEGVYSVDSGITVLFGQISASGYADSAGGKSAVETVIAGGADVVFGMGDGATLGYIQAINAHPGVKYIADIGDVTAALDDPGVLLTSVIWDYTATYEQAIKDVEAGTFGSKNYELTVGNGGLYLQDTPNLTAEIKAAVKTATDAIDAGTIEPSGAKDSAAVKDVIAAKKAA